MTETCLLMNLLMTLAFCETVRTNAHNVLVIHLLTLHLVCFDTVPRRKESEVGRKTATHDDHRFFMILQGGGGVWTSLYNLRVYRCRNSFDTFPSLFISMRARTTHAHTHNKCIHLQSRLLQNKRWHPCSGNLDTWVLPWEGGFFPFS